MNTFRYSKYIVSPTSDGLSIHLLLHADAAPRDIVQAYLQVCDGVVRVCVCDDDDVWWRVCCVLCLRRSVAPPRRRRRWKPLRPNSLAPPNKTQHTKTPKKGVHPAAPPQARPRRQPRQPARAAHRAAGQPAGGRGLGAALFARRRAPRVDDGQDRRRGAPAARALVVGGFFFNLVVAAAGGCFSSRGFFFMAAGRGVGQLPCFGGEGVEDKAKFHPFTRVCPLAVRARRPRRRRAGGQANM